MASEKWSNPTVCLVPMSWPTEYARHLDVRTTSIYPLPKMSPDRAIWRIFALPGGYSLGAFLGERSGPSSGQWSHNLPSTRVSEYGSDGCVGLHWMAPCLGGPG